MTPDAVKAPPPSLPSTPANELPADGMPTNGLPARAHRLPVPAAALGPWLADIDDIVELKVTLRAVALLAEGIDRRGVPPSLTPATLLDDDFLASGVASAAADSDGSHSGHHSGAAAAIRAGLAAALRRETLAAVRAAGGEIRIFLNDDAARRYFARAELTPIAPAARPANPPAFAPPGSAPPPAGRANIFALYEKHIGTYGHNIAEQLRAAEQEYPAQWIADAFALAADRDITSWNYIWNILRRWHRDGRREGLRGTQRYDNGKPGRHTAPDRRTGYLDYYRRRYGRLPWESDDGESGDADAA